MIYNRVYTVPYWVVSYLDKYSKTTEEFFRNAEAMVIEWPATGFYQKLMSLRNKGYSHLFSLSPEEIKEKGVGFSVDAINKAYFDHIEDKLGLNCVCSYVKNIPFNMLRVKNESDAVQLFNFILSNQDPINLSQNFRIQENCRSATGPKTVVFFTLDSEYKDVDLKVISTLSEKTITIGKGNGYSIDFSDVKSKNEATNKLSEYFTNLMNNNK